MTRALLCTGLVALAALGACKSQKPSESSGFLDIEITPQNPFVSVGSQIQLHAKILGAPGIPQGVHWRSEAVEIATVDSKGLVSGLNEGVAPIRATWVQDTLAYRVVEVFVTAVPVPEGRGAKRPRSRERPPRE